MSHDEYLGRLKEALILPPEVRGDVGDELESHLYQADFKDPDYINSVGEPEMLAEQINRSKTPTFLEMLTLRSTWTSSAIFLVSILLLGYVAVGGLSVASRIELELMRKEVYVEELGHTMTVVGNIPFGWVLTVALPLFLMFALPFSAVLYMRAKKLRYPPQVVVSVILSLAILAAVMSFVSIAYTYYESQYRGPMVVVSMVVINALIISGIGAVLYGLTKWLSRSKISKRTQ